MIKLEAALLKLEGALDYTTDPQVRSLIDNAQQAIEAAKRVMEQNPQEVCEDSLAPYMGGYQQAA